MAMVVVVLGRGGRRLGYIEDIKTKTSLHPGM